MNATVRMLHRTTLVALVVLGISTTVGAQTYAVDTDLLFYGDNTEFTNPFRQGDTTLGALGRVVLEVRLNETVTLRGGVFGGGRFGAHDAFEHLEPAIALELRKGPSRFIFGSLDTTAWRHQVDGPDLDTPHELLPPLQRETLVFTRGQEMGLQWLVDAPRVSQDAWINWQRLNTDRWRERFDAGSRTVVGLARTLQLHGQWHIVHEGGQVFNHGAVSDSQGGALGVAWSPTRVAPGFTLETHVVGTRFVPDRARAALRQAGVGVFGRVAVRRAGWRAHALAWRGRDTLKDEGDANYLSLVDSGALYRGVRDYSEIGLTRRFTPAPDVHVLAGYRLHRIEGHYEYSYRIAARVHIRRPL